ncbi:MAG TPA: endonuclease III [Ignavibacteria bacterium]|nr:endonuclease III [Bacteroidota bacterium]HRI84650.1 endonuclease III [Ignavibacteria bacterium]HRJ99264.1 endonuclease III [Ignavibacteria bacterium]
MNKSGLKKHSSEIVKRLEAEYPDVKCHLDFNSPFELLISTVLAAQCTDIRVNMVMSPLYKSKYRSPSDILKDGIDNYRENIKSINFFNNKAKSVLSICEALVNKFGGKVPDNMEDLTSLSGVGRKSASVILGNCYGKNDVIIVDTHLKRVSARLGLIEYEEPEKIENELKEIIPADDQFYFSMRIGEHGRQICKAKKPDCGKCILNDICPDAFKF